MKEKEGGFVSDKKEKKLFKGVGKLEFSEFCLLDQGFGLGKVKKEAKREEKQRKRDLGLLAKMRTEIQERVPQRKTLTQGTGLSPKKIRVKSEKEDLSSPVLKELPEEILKAGKLGLSEKTLPPPLGSEKVPSKSKKKVPLESVLSRQMKRVPPPKEEILAKEKLIKARKQIQKKTNPTSWSFLFLGHIFDLLVVISLIGSEVLLLGALFNREEIFLLDVILHKFSFSNLSVFTVLEGVSFLYLAYFLYYLLFSLFLGRSLGFFLLLKMRKNTQGKKA